MRPLTRLPVFAALALLGSPGTAQGVALPVEATVMLEIANTPAVTVLSLGLVTVNGSGGAGRIETLAFGAGVANGQSVVPVTDPAAFPITGLQVSVSNAPGTLARTSGGALGGSVALPGFAKVCLFGTTFGCQSPVSNIVVPLAPVGAGGASSSQGPVNISVYGAPWTTGTVSYFPIATRMGFAAGPTSAPSSTARPGGVLQLVTPIYITTNIAASAVVPAFATLTLRFVPEPATLLLVGGALAGLAAWGARS